MSARAIAATALPAAVLVACMAGCAVAREYYRYKITGWTRVEPQHDAGDLESVGQTKGTTDESVTTAPSGDGQRGD